MLYFAYGSNMLTARLRRRVPTAQPVGLALLQGHILRFHKVGQDGSGKCDVHKSPDGQHHVWGVVFNIAHGEKPLLDLAEGVGAGYECKQVELETAEGAGTNAFTYYATHTDDKLAPFEWYAAFVIAGAIEHGLPSQYISDLSRIPCQPDPDVQRREANELILKSRP